jgi:hypothetical protein
MQRWRSASSRSSHDSVSDGQTQAMESGVSPHPLAVRPRRSSTSTRARAQVTRVDHLRAELKRQASLYRQEIEHAFAHPDIGGEHCTARTHPLERPRQALLGNFPTLPRHASRYLPSGDENVQPHTER